MNDWRKPCEHGEYKWHLIDGLIVNGSCPGGSPVTAADLEGETGTIRQSEWRGGRREWVISMDSDVDTVLRQRFVLIPIPDPQVSS